MGRLLLIVECQEPNGKCWGNSECGKSFATSKMIGSGKNDHWMPLLGGNFDENFCLTLKYLPNRPFISCKREKNTVIIHWRNQTTPSLHGWAKSTPDRWTLGTSRCVVLRKTPYHLLSSPRTHSLSRTIRKLRAQNEEFSISKMEEGRNCSLQKCPCHKKTKAVQTFQIKGAKETRQPNATAFSRLHSFLEGNGIIKGIIRTTEKTRPWTKSRWEYHIRINSRRQSLFKREYHSS